MAIGDIKVSSLKIGNMDLSGKGSSKALIAGFNIYEDILNPYGPVAEIRVIDHGDEIGNKNISGSYDQDVEINFSGDENIGSMMSAGGNGKFKFKMYQSKDINDQSIHNTGSGHHKQYDIRCVSEEFLNAQGNYIQKSFTGPTSDVIKHVVEKGLKSQKKLKASKTKGNRRININNRHPGDVIRDLNSEHVSDKYESSCFTLFQRGDEYIFSTFEELFEGQSKVTLKQSTNLNFSSRNVQERQNSILWFKPSSTFFSGPRALSKSDEHAFDLTTHKVVARTNNQKQNNFKYADSNPQYKGSPSNAKGVPVRYIHDKVNNKDKHSTSEAKTKRADFLAHLAQDSAELECYYNPNITLGSMITLDIPEKTNKSDGGERQFNGKCLVVAIRTKYRISREPPNCTMILRVVKASFKESSGGQA